MTLRVLHLSDLHWAPWSADDLKIVVDALLADLAKLKADRQLEPDIIIFSGDLAMGGDDSSWFQGGYDALINPLIAQTGVPVERVFIAPGNHDIARDEVRARPSVERYHKEQLTTKERINAFMDKPYREGDEKELLLRRMQNFYDAHDSYQPAAISSSPFLRTYVIDHQDCSIGVACFNTAWRSTGEADNADYGHLILGERAIDQALKDVGGCDFRIAIHHHPLDWLNEADRSSTDFLTRKSFHLSCCGHVHTSRPAMSKDAAGICILSQAGSVYDKRDWFNGYQFIEIDLPSREYKFIVREYFDKQRRFDSANSVCEGGEMVLQNVPNGNERRDDQIELFMRANRSGLRGMVAKHLNFIGNESLSSDQIIRQFVAPPFVERAVKSLEKEFDNSKAKSKKTLVDAISADGNTLFVGGSQSGKTSLAYFIANLIAFDNPSKRSIPVYIDARNFSFNLYAYRKAITNFYDTVPSGFNIDSAIEQGLFTFIFDNIAADEDTLIKLAANLKGEQLNSNKWIVVGTPNQDGISPDRLFNEHLPSFTKLHIRPLNRGAIRTLSKRWCESTDADARTAYTMVMAQIVRDGLPRTPYMVSLLLWGLHQGKEMVKINEAILLGNIIDHLIGKADFRLSRRGALHPVGKEITLQNLSKFLREKGGIADENEVTSFLIAFFERKRLSFLGGDVLEKLISCGVLKRDGSTISFKYPCFQDYFYAQLMRNDRALLDQHMTGLNFLDVRREIELLAGMRQQNDDIIDAIIATIDARVPEKFAKQSAEDFEAIAESEIKSGTTRADLGRIRRTRLSDEQVDEMMDEADRRALGRGDRPVRESLKRADGNIAEAAKEVEADAIANDRDLENAPIRPATHMAAIDTLARVVRNSDFTDYDKKGPAARHVLQSWVRIFLLIIDEISAILLSIGDKTGDKLDDEEFNTILYIMSKWMFNVVGEAVIGHLASPAMSDTLLTILDSETVGSGEKMLLLYMVEEADVAGWQERWSAVIRDKKSSGFMVDSFVERLMYISTSRALDDAQVKRVRKVVDEIEERLDWTNAKKASVVENIKSAVALANVNEGLTTNIN